MCDKGNKKTPKCNTLEKKISAYVRYLVPDILIFDKTGIMESDYFIIKM
jgi:hypothetical protein